MFLVAAKILHEILRSGLNKLNGLIFSQQLLGLPCFGINVIKAPIIEFCSLPLQNAFKNISNCGFSNLDLNFYKGVLDINYLVSCHIDIY